MAILNRHKVGGEDAGILFEASLNQGNWLVMKKILPPHWTQHPGQQTRMGLKFSISLVISIAHGGWGT